MESRTAEVWRSTREFVGGGVSGSVGEQVGYGGEETGLEGLFHGAGS